MQCVILSQLSFMTVVPIKNHYDLSYLAESTEVCNFADNTTLHACDKDN